MATETLRPNADGDDVAWTATGAANDWDCVDEAVSDDDTTYVFVAAGTAVDTDELVNLAVSAISESDSISSVALHLNAKGSGAVLAEIKFLWKENGVTTVGGANTVTSSYVDYSESRSVRPSDAVAWSLADVNALQVGVRRTGNALAGAARCTQVWVEVTFASGVRNRLGLLGVGR